MKKSQDNERNLHKENKCLYMKDTCFYMSFTEERIIYFVKTVTKNMKKKKKTSKKLQICLHFCFSSFKMFEYSREAMIFYQ